MLRMSIQNITNELSATYSEKARTAGVKLSIDELPHVLQIYKLIFDYCKATGTLTTARTNTYDIDNGVLMINGKHIARVAGMINKPGYMNTRPGVFVSDNSIDYEDLILRRQEA